MAAHQRHHVGAEAFRQILRLRHVGDEQVGVAEIVGDVPDRHRGADKAARMNDRPQRCPLGDAERQGVPGMGVDDGHDLRPRREDRRMYKAFEIKAAVPAAHRPTVEVELDDVSGAHQLRRQRTGDQKAVGMVRVTNPDMAIGIDDLLPRQDSVGDHQVLDQIVENAHGRSAQKRAASNAARPRYHNPPSPTRAALPADRIHS